MEQPEEDKMLYGLTPEEKEVYVDYLIMLLKKMNRLQKNREWREYLIKKYSKSGFKTDETSDFFNEIIHELNIAIEEDGRELYEWAGELTSNTKPKSYFKDIS